MQLLDLLVDHRNQLLQSVNDYNKRLDRTVILYLTALYAAIGLRVTGKVNLTDLSNDPELTLVAFLFIFLNLCIIIHGVSQSAWSMALAKFVHINVNDDICEIVKKSKKRMPSSFTEWDIWNNDLKGLAVRTRDIVVVLWVIQVLGVSIFSLRLVDLKGFHTIHPVQTYISAVFLFVFLTFALYLGLLELYLTNKFQRKTDTYSPPRLMLKVGALGISIVLFLLTFLFAIK